MLGYAANAYGQMEVLKSDVNQLKAMNVDTRLTRIETKIDYMIQMIQKRRTTDAAF